MAGLSGFFAKPKTVKKVVKRQSLCVTTGDFCAQCNLDKAGCLHPNLPYSGQGRLGILILGETPGKNDDLKGIHNSGDAGAVLKKTLRFMGLDLDRDFWYDNVCRCRPVKPGKEEEVVTDEIDIKNLQFCRPKYWDTIRATQPKAIFLMGTSAIKSFFMDRTKPITRDLGATRWRGSAIPDPVTGAWVFPFFGKDFLLKNSDVMGSFKADLTAALRKVNEPFPPKVDYPSMVKKLTDPLQITTFLKTIQAGKFGVVSVDYETSALKPYGDGRKIWTASIAVDENLSYAFPIEYPGVMDVTHQGLIKHELKRAFQSGKAKFVGHNLQMEERWNRGNLGFEHLDWHWDTMQAAHILAEQQLYCNLDTQVFVHWGYEYGENITPYKEGNPINRMHEIPLDELLEYNGLDALFTLKLYHKQMEVFNYKGQDSEKRANAIRMNRAYKLFHEGTLAFCDLEEEGLYTKSGYYQEQYERMQKRIDTVKRLLYSDPACLQFKKVKGRAPDFGESGVSDDLKVVLFDILKAPIIKKTASGKPSLSESALEEMHLPITKNLVKLRKLSKLQGTYLKGFVDETHGNYLRPNFNLHLTRSFRSSSDSPNFQNIPKRDADAQALCRNGIIPRPGHILGEVDYGAMEVRIIACWSKDPVLVNEMLNDIDPHGMWATELGIDKEQYKWMLKKKQKEDPNYGDELLPEHKKKAFKLARFDAKNAFVFALFYGSYYRSICRSLVERGYDVDEATVKRAEKLFWSKYKVLKAKYEWAKKVYQEKGKVFMMFGHERRGFLTYNQICNSYIQGPAFHCLLTSLVEINKKRRKEQWKTKIRGQIHDAILFDFHPDEKDYVINEVTRIMTKHIAKVCPEIIVPLLAEWSICQVDEPWPMKKDIPTPEAH